VNTLDTALYTRQNRVAQLFITDKNIKANLVMMPFQQRIDMKKSWKIENSGDRKPEPTHYKR